VRDATDYPDDIKDVKVNKDMLVLAQDLVDQGAATSTANGSRIITRRR
jgi:non-homologous end joining protein Ku